LALQRVESNRPFFAVLRLLTSKQPPSLLGTPCTRLTGTETGARRGWISIVCRNNQGW
jgi:hypothetical protein